MASSEGHNEQKLETNIQKQLGLEMTNTGQNNLILNESQFPELEQYNVPSNILQANVREDPTPRAEISQIV